MVIHRFFFQRQWIMLIFHLFLVPWSVQNWVSAYWKIPSQCVRKARQSDTTGIRMIGGVWSIASLLFIFGLPVVLRQAVYYSLAALCAQSLAGYLITHSHSGRSCDFHCTPGELTVSDGWSGHIGDITCNLEILHFTMLISIGLLDGKDDTCILFSSLASNY